LYYAGTSHFAAFLTYRYAAGARACLLPIGILAYMLDTKAQSIPLVLNRGSITVSKVTEEIWGMPIYQFLVCGQRENARTRHEAQFVPVSRGGVIAAGHIAHSGN
jgi:hypothetical protein